jgi:hypothetical protein
MPQPQDVPKLIARMTLVAGGALLVSPRTFTKPLGLDDQQLAIRALGLADLMLVPGLHSGNSPAAWMTARGALSLAQGAYLSGVAPRAANSRVAKLGAFTLFGLSIADALTAARLHRQSAE